MSTVSDDDFVRLFQRTFGAPDSAGTGFRVMAVAN